MVDVEVQVPLEEVESLYASLVLRESVFLNVDKYATLSVVFSWFFLLLRHTNTAMIMTGAVMRAIRATAPPTITGSELVLAPMLPPPPSSV